MNTNQIRTKVKELIAAVADLEADEIADNAHFIEDLDLDSLAMLEMGVDIDYAFKLGVAEERLQQLRSVPDTVALVEECLAAAALRNQVA